MTSTPRGRKPRTPARKPETDDEPSDGNGPTLTRPEQRMSREKQKFFRFSAFNLVKRRRRRSSSEWEGWGGVRVTRVQRLELRLERRPASPRDTVSTQSSARSTPSPLSPVSPSSASPSPSSRTSSSEAEPPAPAAVSTVFERLAADEAPGGVWGFAAEAQKQRRLEPEARPPPERHRVARRRSRCGERLLTTLFDGLSEFYSVRTASRSVSRPRLARTAERQEDRAVLKETRSTFRRYQAELRRARSRTREPEPEPEPVVEEEPVPVVRARSRSRSRPRVDARLTKRAESRGRSVDSSPIRREKEIVVEEPRLSASQLVRTAAVGKHRTVSEDSEKLYRGLALAGRQAGVGRPATNQTGKIGSWGAVKVS